MKKIAITNQKGGCGKTTTAINLAGALAEAGKRTLVIDLDPQAHASFGLNKANLSMDRSIYNILTDDIDKSRPINECIAAVMPNLDIIPSNILLSTLEQELKDKEDAVSKLHLALTMSQLDYDYIIIDCPPSLGFLTFNALRAADQIIVPIDMSAFSLMGVGKLLGMLELIKIKIFHAPQVNALATLYDRRTRYSQHMYDEIYAFFKSQLLSTTIRMNVDLKKAAAKGVCVTQFNKDSIGALDYTALAQELLRADGSTEFEKALSSVSDALETEAAILPRPGFRPNPCEADERSFQTSDARVEIKNVSESQPEPVNPMIYGSNAAIATMLVATPAVSVPVVKVNECVSFKLASVQHVDKPAGIEYIFNIDAPHAKDVYVVGDFNAWKQGDECRMSKFESGRWVKGIELAPGRHKYKFVVDGEWVTDSANCRREQNSYGTFDSILNL